MGSISRGQIVNNEALSASFTKLSARKIADIAATNELSMSQLTAMLKTAEFDKAKRGEIYSLYNSAVAKKADTAATKAQTTSTIAATGATSRLIAVTKGLSAAMAANPLMAMFLALNVVVPIAIKIFDKFNITLKEQKEIVAGLTSEVSSLQSEYDQLAANDNLTEAEQRKLELLKAQLAVKKEQLEIDSKKLEGKQWTDDNVDYARGGRVTRLGTRSEAYGDVDKYKAAKESLEEYNDEIARYSDVTGLSAKELVEANKELEKVQKKQADAKQQMVDSRQAILDSIESLEELKKNTGFLEPENQKLLNYLREMAQSLGVFSDGTKDAKDSLGSLGDTVALVNTAVSEYVESLKNLEDAEKKATNGASLSYEEKEDLLKLYPQLESAIYRTADGWGVEKTAIDTLRQAQKEQALAQLEYQKQQSRVAFEETLRRIGLTEKEMESVATLLGVYKFASEVLSGHEGAGTPAQQAAVEYINALKTINAAQRKLEDISKGGIGGGSSSSSKSSAKSSSDAWKDAFSKAYAEIQYLRKMDQISTQEYHDRLSALDQKYFAGQSKYIEEHRKNLEELYSLQQEIFGDYTKNIEHEIFLLSKRDGTEQQQINMYRQLQEKLNMQADKYRSRGIKDNDELIKNLQQQWWSYADEIENINKKIADSAREAMQKALDITLDLQKERKAQYESTLAAVVNVIDGEISALREQKEALQESNEERSNAAKLIDLENDLLKAQNALLSAQTQRNIRIFTGGEWIWTTNKEKIEEAEESVRNAEKAIADFRVDQQIAEIDKQIKAWEEYKEEWTSVADIYEIEQNRLNASQVLGVNWEKEILDQRLSGLRTFVQEYNRLLSSIGGLENSKAVLTKSTGSGNTINTAIDTMQENSAKWHTASQSEKIALEKANETMGASLGLVKGSDGVWRKKDGTRAYATGTTFASGGISVVGENGPELRVLNNGDGIIPTKQSKFLWNFADNPVETLMKSGIFRALRPAMPAVSPVTNYNFDGMTIEYKGDSFKNFLTSMEQYVKTHRG